MWQEAHSLVLATYRETQVFPVREIYGLTAQMRRAATSVGSNIAEACGKSSSADFARHLGIAFGSASELKYQFLLSRDLGYLSSEVHDELERQVDAVMRMLSVLIKSSTNRNVVPYAHHSDQPPAVNGQQLTANSQQPRANS